MGQEELVVELGAAVLKGLLGKIHALSPKQPLQRAAAAQHNSGCGVGLGACSCFIMCGAGAAGAVNKLYEKGPASQGAVDTVAPLSGGCWVPVGEAKQLKRVQRLSSLTAKGKQRLDVCFHFRHSIVLLAFVLAVFGRGGRRRRSCGSGCLLTNVALAPNLCQLCMVPHARLQPCRCCQDGGLVKRPAH